MTTELPIGTGHEEWATVRAAAAGDRTAWDALWGPYHERLHKMVQLRLDPRVRGRVDAADVLQEAWIEARGRLADYAASVRPMPLVLWLRFLVGQQLLILACPLLIPPANVGMRAASAFASGDITERH